MNQKGFAHLLVVAVVVVIAVVGFVGWRVLNKDKLALNQASQQAAAECNKDIDDKDLCKFLTSWEQSQQYRVVSTSTGGGAATESTFEVDGDKSHIVITGEAGYETISIGNATYTKAGNTWWKQTQSAQEEDVTEDFEVDFEEPSADGDAANQTTYKSLGKEACGSLQCFKYQVVDPSNTETTEYIWFDDKDYKLRKTSSQGPDGTSESVFEYDNVSVSEPSPVRELGPNQYIVPGQSEPVTLPAAQ